MGEGYGNSSREGPGQKKVVSSRVFDHDSLEETVASHEHLAPKARLRERLAKNIGGWMRRRLQRRVEKEWHDYKQPPEISVGPFFRRRGLKRGDTQVYRSLVQIHFHPRPRGS